jgi:MFS family permease
MGIALVDGFAATLALAFLAGLGTALFTPASLAALPSLVEQRRLPVATSVYGAITDLGLAVGPALTAAFLIIASPETILAANSLTFALSALVLARLHFGAAPVVDPSTSAASGTLLIQARQGIRSIGLVKGLWPILGASAAGVFFGGLVNVAELPFITDDLAASDAVFSAMVALVGAGIAAGSLAGGGGGEIGTLTNRFTLGLLLSGAGFLAAGLVPSLVVVLVMFTLAGFGNGLMLVHERLFIQQTVPDELMARVFGVRDATTAWGFGIAFMSAGALVSAAGPGTVIVIAGAGVAVVGLVAGYFLRQDRLRPEPAASASVATEAR